MINIRGNINLNIKYNSLSDLHGREIYIAVCEELLFNVTVQNNRNNIIMWKGNSDKTEAEIVEIIWEKSGNYC